MVEPHPTCMKLLTVSVGLPRDTVWHGETVTSGIYKKPIEGRVALRRFNLDGDRQADCGVHGGEVKAVYFYPGEHYAYWEKELGGRELPHGVFGENLTTEGLLEGSVMIGDCYSVGSAEVVVTQPRIPCYKLAMRFEDDHIVKRFLASGRIGFYAAVTREGEVGAGDDIALVSREPESLSVTEILRLHIMKEPGDGDLDLLRRGLGIAALPEGWKADLRRKLGAPAGEGA